MRYWKYLIFVCFLLPSFSVYSLEDSEITTVTATVPTDLDGDGLPNDWELDNGLDPTDPSDASLDSDFDGLTTLEEYNRGTDFLNPDTDGGTLWDGDEVLQGKDPLDPTDDLVVTPDVVDRNIKESPNPAYDSRGDEDGDGVPTREEYTYGTNPRKRDTDGDGIGDYQEIFEYCSSPNSKDTDMDGLTDYAEVFIYGTNPCFFDTDNDGISDGNEVLTGSPPRTPSEEVSLSVDFYLSSAYKSKGTFYSADSVELIQGMPFKIRIANKKDVVSTTISFNGVRRHFLDSEVKTSFVAPEKEGAYYFITQVLYEDGSFDQLKKVFYVKKRGTIFVTNKLFKKEIPLASSLVELYLLEKNTGMLVPYGSDFYNTGEAYTDKRGEYAFMVSADEKYMMTVYSPFNKVLYDAPITLDTTEVINTSISIEVNPIIYLSSLLKTLF